MMDKTELTEDDFDDSGLSPAEKTRIRTCSDCGKRLGSTVAKCYDCGGEDASPSREERLQDARTWKMLLGVDPQLIDDAHQP